MAGVILPRHYIMGIFVFMIFVVGGVSMINIMVGDDEELKNDPSYAQFNKSFNKLDEVNDTVTSYQEDIESLEADPGVLGFFDAIFGSSWNTLKLLFNSLGFMKDVFYGLSAVFGVPLWVITIITGLVTILFVFAIYTIVFQREI